jgi:hypothetical protein
MPLKFGLHHRPSNSVSPQISQKLKGWILISGKNLALVPEATGDFLFPIHFGPRPKSEIRNTVLLQGCE